MEEQIWRAKLAAWTHDPAEKALVLLRDPAGHEGGTVRKLREMIFPEGVSSALKAVVKKADHWASAADRPQFPRAAGDGSYAPWTQVRFAESPELIHPLSGERIAIRERLADLDPALIKAVSFDHFSGYVQKTDGKIDARRTALAFWRFAPELTAKDMSSLWQLLPADTRVPDHTIWAHLDLSSAFSSAVAAGTPALLSMSFGPVQGFIAQARTTSDLWAGSHLLSRIVWEGLKVVCEKFGPDAVIFPQLRGIPLVDLWLRDEMNLPADLFEQCDWRKHKTDANPLFGAALPNKFMAVVPQDQVLAVSEEITRRARGWVQQEARETVEKLLGVASVTPEEALPCYAQIREQLSDFPEVNWAAVPWSLAVENDGKICTTELHRAMAPFFPVTDTAPGFLDTEVWKLLNSDDIQVAGASFFHPNAGVLYPAFYDLLDRAGAAAKAVRPFSRLPQSGYRCSLCGENEWLTTDRAQLDLPPGKRKDATTLWTKVADKRPAWARKGEHLCAPCALKRLWPSRFAEQVKTLADIDMQRFVVSTHTMALATSLGRWLEKGSVERNPLPLQLKAMLLGAAEQAALPRKLATKLSNADEDGNLLARRLPALLDQLRENDGEDERQAIEQTVAKVLGDKPEAYYAMILLDGDKMGAWLSGSDDDKRLTFRESWHSQIQSGVSRFAGNEKLSAYLDARRPPSPARHMSISGALNGFSLDLVRHVVEDLYKGKLIYAGGDDVLAMISVDDLLPAMYLLRLVYAGIFPHGGALDVCWRDIFGQTDKVNWLDIAKGHVRYKKRLYRVMGATATASAGAVIAHHTAPLGSVLRTLREAENRAKNAGGRDAFSVSLLKRAGGAVHLVCPWSVATEATGPTFQAIPQSPMGLLIRLRDTLAGDGMSRRVAYLVQQWANQLPDAQTFGGESHYQSLLATTLAYQFERQSKGPVRQVNGELARELATLAIHSQGRNGRNRPAEFLVDFLSVAEFLAREGRSVEVRKEATHG